MNRIINGGVVKAIYDDDIDNFKRLIKQGKRIDIKDNLGWTPLHAAVSRNRVDMVEILCQHSDAPINSRCYEGQTPLFLACEQNRNPRIVEVLLSYGAEPNIPNNEESKPLHHVRSIEIAEALITAGASLNSQDLNGYTALHCAIEHGHISVANILLNSGADPNLCECNGLNALMLALSKNDIVAEELEVGLARVIEDVNAVAVDGWSALMLAANSGKILVVKELLERGADPNISAYGLTALHLAVMRQDVSLWKMLWRPDMTENVYANLSLLHLMLIHRWFVPERLECFYEALSSPKLHHPNYSFLNILFGFDMDNKLQPEMCRLVSTAMNAEKFLKRTYQTEIIRLLETYCPTDLKQRILEVLHQGGANIGLSQFVIVASEFEPSLVPYLLPLAVNLRPLQLWDALIRSQRRDIAALRLALHMLTLCTPSWRGRHRYLQRLPTPTEITSQHSIRYIIRYTTIENSINRSRQIDVLLDENERKEMLELLELLSVTLNASSFPTLKELARDVIRSKRTGLKPFSVQNIPRHVIDIIELRHPINIIPQL